MKKYAILILLFNILPGCILDTVSTHAGKAVPEEHIPYSKILLVPDNTLIFRDVITPGSVSIIKEKALKMDTNLPSNYPLYLILHTPGGSIESGIQLFQTLSALNRPVHTITIFAASMGFHIVQELGTRYILKYGTLMNHKATGSFEGEFRDGKSQLDSRYNYYLKRLNKMDLQVIKRTKNKQTLNSYLQAIANELWIDGEEAIRQGYADAIVDFSCDKALLQGVENIFQTAYIFNLAITFTVTYSQCPSILYPLKISVLVKDMLGKRVLDIPQNVKEEISKRIKRYFERLEERYTRK